jgi:nucleoside-diphosphate-sugar epimerase
LTGKHVVQQLLDGGNTVRAVVRSKQKMMSLLSSDKDYGDRLQLTEATILDVDDSTLSELVSSCDAVVSTLGHTMDMAGLFGRKYRRLVTDTVKRLTSAMSAPQKFILMSSVGVAHPADDPRSGLERSLIFLVRHLITPHADNEEAASYLRETYSPEQSGKSLAWCMVRPDDLIDGPVSEYQLLDKPKSGLFGSNVSTRANVAHSMVQLILNDDLWNKWKFQMPVLDNVGTEDEKHKK